MGQELSKEKQLYNQVSSGNVERIRFLRQEGADLEWMDKEGKTPLILACTKAELYDVAQTLIELGANVNAYRPASYPYAGTSMYNAETPLYHAARRGLKNTVKLLLSNGANFDCQTSLQIARYNGWTSVVREIESHICLFSGWMREFNGPAILDLFAPRLFSRRVLVVIVPTTGSNHPMSYKFQLAVYASLHDAQPRMAMALRDPNLEEPKSMHPDTSVMIYDNDDITTRSLKLAPSIEEGRRQLKWFCDACKGIPQPRPPVFLQTVLPSAPPLPDEYIASVEEGPIHYPLRNPTPGDAPSASVDSENTEDVSSGQCAICMDDPSNAVCVPCGHLAGCMSCLIEIKSKEWGCPVCRAKIDQIIKVHRV